MKQQITKKIEIDYGHTLPNHYSFCSQIHGHRGVIEATVEGEISHVSGSSDQGMVMDFGFLKKIMMEQIHAKLDHGFAVWKDDPTISSVEVESNPIPVSTKAFILSRNSKIVITDEPPTAEYLAKWCFYQILPHVPPNILLVRVVFYETPNSKAEYSPSKDVERA